MKNKFLILPASKGMVIQMKIIGIIGQTGAGKSEVCAALRGAGVYTIDGDRLARDITQPGSPVLAALQQAFGADILQEGGELNRALLAERAFRSPEQTARLNAITHPAITRLARAELEQAEREGYQAAAFEGAALLESPLKADCDWFVAVTAPEPLRLERILARDGITREQALRRMQAQREERYYTHAAKVIIRSDTVHALAPQIEALLAELRDRS